MAKPVVPPNDALHRALVKAAGTCNSVISQIEYMQQLAIAAPELAPQVDELQAMHDHLSALCRAGMVQTIDELQAENRG